MPVFPPPPVPATLTADIYARLAGDPTLAATLAIFQDTLAVFTGPPIPENATLPAVVVEAGDEDPFDTKTTMGRMVSRSITVYADASGDITTVEAIAARVVALFHRQAIGAGGWRCSAIGPAAVPTDGTLYGRRIVLEMTSG